MTGTTRGPNQLRRGVQGLLTGLALRHHFGAGFSVEGQLPVGTLRFDQGTNLDDQYLSGLGDLRLSARYELAALWGAGGFKPSVVVEGGLGLPTGTVARLGDEDGLFPPNVLSVGLGATTLSGRVLATQFVTKALGFTAWGGAMTPVTPTNLGIVHGSSFDGGLGLLFVPTKGLWLSGRAALQHRLVSESLTNGVLTNSGGTWLALDGSAAWRVHERAVVVLGLRAPIFAAVNGAQISETFTTNLAIMTTFGGVEDAHDHGDEHGHGDAHDHEDEHGHEHGDAHDHGDEHAGDVADLATGGASFRLEDALVSGKVTVIDFWAEWCAPCKELDALLRELAAANPTLAVRRVEVPTFETPVARAHLARAEGLPVLWIYDAAGARVATLELSTVDEVRAAIREALAEHASTR